MGCTSHHNLAYETRLTAYVRIGCNVRWTLSLVTCSALTSPQLFAKFGRMTKTEIGHMLSLYYCYGVAVRQMLQDSYSNSLYIAPYLGNMMHILSFDSPYLGNMMHKVSFDSQYLDKMMHILCLDSPYLGNMMHIWSLDSPWIASYLNSKMHI